MDIFGMAFGLGLGAVLGLSVGPSIFPVATRPKDYSFLAESADDDPSTHPPRLGGTVGPEMRNLMRYTQPWVKWPDYERAHMLNRALHVMWPTLSNAVVSEMLKQLRPQLQQQVFQKYGFIEDIMFGDMSMRGSDAAACFTDKMFTLGTRPPRLGGVKFIDTPDDEVIVEVPLVWGSNCQLDVAVLLRLGPFRFYVPMQLSNLQCKVDTRITVRPLVEVIPITGGMTVSLLSAPLVDFSLKLFWGVDLMSLPVTKDIIPEAMKIVLGDMLIYPNSMSFPIMPNFGLPPSAKGALNVKLLRATDLRHNHTYCVLEVREGRGMRSSSIANTYNPEWNEEFNLIVDDFVHQSLSVYIYDDDFGFNDEVVASGELDFGQVVGEITDPKTNQTIIDFQLMEFIKVANTEQLVAIKLRKEVLDNRVLKTAKTMMKLGANVGRSLLMAQEKEKQCHKTYGIVYLKVMFLPFFAPTYDDDHEDKDLALRGKQDVQVQLTRQVNTSKVPDKLKGVLTVNLIRCINLAGDEDEIDGYVRLLVTGDEADQVQESYIIYNEASPRWGQKFDFVMVNAGAMLYVDVMSKRSMVRNALHAANVFSKKKTKEEFDKKLGKLMLPVRDAVRNGKLKDMWSLHDAEKGQIELELQWQTVYFKEDF